MKALLAFRTLFLARRNGLLLALSLSLVTLAAGVALLGTSGWFITASALTTAGLAFNLFVPSALVRGFSFIRILSRYGERLAGHDATLRLLADIRAWLFARLFPRLPLRDRSLRHGDLVSRLTADVDALDTAFLVAVGPILAALVIGTALTILLAMLLPGAALVYAISLLGSVLVVPAGLAFLSRGSGTAAVTSAADARAAVLDGLDGHADLVAMGVLGTAQAHFTQTVARLARARGSLATLTALAGFLVQALSAIALVGSLWVGLDAHAAGQIGGPVLAGLLLAIAASFEATNVIVRSVGKLTTAVAAAERLLAIGESPILVADPVSPDAMPADHALRLAGVGFHYPGGAPVLDNLDLEIAPGEHVAITGASGGGKSTLLSLILRLDEPVTGQITLGGKSIARLRLSDLHRRIALLSQDSPLFHDTIRANLLVARQGAGDAQLWAALDQAGLGDFVRGHRLGLDALVGEGGRTLSAGQARRLCLARTLLSPAGILLLDEPTTGLDRAAEEAFFHALHAGARGRSVIVVTHAAIPDGTMDRVLEMRHGRLA